VAAWLSLTGALHGYVYDGTIQEKDTRKQKPRGRQRQTTSAIFPRHDSHRWLLRRCLATVPLFFNINCRLPPVIDGCFKDVLQQWPLFVVVDCRLPSDGSH